MWDVIVCTCQNTESAVSTKKELQIRQRKGLLGKDVVVLTVEDPNPNIGSGSATLNALLCVAEYLAAKEGLTAVSEDVLSNTRILMLHLGTISPFSPCGHGFMPHPSSSQPGEGSGFDQTEIYTNIDALMEFLGKLCKNSPPGMWVTSTDMLLKAPQFFEPLDVKYFEDPISVMTVNATPEYARLHGACKVTETRDISRIIHYGGKEQIQSCIRPDNLCDILAGLVYFNPYALGTFLSLHTMPPLDACTYAGQDNGADPLSLSLFFDILLCLTTEMDYDSYVDGSFKAAGGVPNLGGLPQTIATKQVHQRARSVLWKALEGLKIKAVRLSSVEHSYLWFKASDVLDRYKREGGKSCIINSILPDGTTVGDDSLLINCNLKSQIVVGRGCFISGLGEAFSDLHMVRYRMPQVHIPDDITVQEIHVCYGRKQMKTSHGIVVLYGLHDNLVAPFDSPEATFCNKPWADLFQRTGITEHDLWLPESPKSLLHARLFVASHISLEVGVQDALWLLSNTHDCESLYRWRSFWRISLSEILRYVDYRSEFSKMRNISFELQRQKMIQVLKENRPECFLPFLHHAVVENRDRCVLETLDQVAQDVDDSLIVCRVYASIADMLGFMAGEARIRAGPAANVAWHSAFAMLEENMVTGTKALALERDNWIANGPDRIIRACRHYERAGQILTRMAVATAKKFIHGVPCTLPSLNQPVTVKVPARVDLAGAWSDTPPQAYEWGGMVTTLSLTVDGEYPSTVVAERLSELKIELVLLAGNGDVIEHLELTELSHLANYSQPHAPGALLKAAFICTGIVDLPSDVSLSDQLSRKFGCGFKLQSLSRLPQGSGLGTSSILGGAIMAALWKASGQEHSIDSLIHAVLYLEQLLTTGGGWQDQCGGLYGGAKISESSKGLPVKIVTRQLQTPPGFMDKLSQHLCLVYTGKTRLARNLLQDVLRNWHSRDKKIVKNMQDLVDNAKRAAAAVESGNLEELGACLNDCQKQKLIMAPGSLPKTSATFMDSIREEIYGCTFAGAGGGGFMVIICKEPKSRERVQEIIKSNKILEDFIVYETAVDQKGLHYV